MQGVRLAKVVVTINKYQCRSEVIRNGKTYQESRHCKQEIHAQIVVYNSVNTGEPFHYAFPYDLAVELFGVEASDFMYEVSQGLCCSYITDFNGVRYVGVSGFELMRAYRGMVLYREMRKKWIDENEVLKHDTSTGKKHGKQCVSNKAKQV